MWTFFKNRYRLKRGGAGLGSGRHGGNGAGSVAGRKDEPADVGESDTERVAGTGDLGTDEREHWWYVFTEQQSAGLQHQGGGRAAEILAERTADGTEFRGTGTAGHEVSCGVLGQGASWGCSRTGSRIRVFVSSGKAV